MIIFLQFPVSTIQLTMPSDCFKLLEYSFDKSFSVANCLQTNNTVSYVESGTKSFLSIPFQVIIVLRCRSCICFQVTEVFTFTEDI